MPVGPSSLRHFLASLHSKLLQRRYSHLHQPPAILSQRPHSSAPCAFANQIAGTILQNELTISLSESIHSKIACRPRKPFADIPGNQLIDNRGGPRNANLRLERLGGRRMVLLLHTCRAPHEPLCQPLLER